jgi:hypothetical protein
VLLAAGAGQIVLDEPGHTNAHQPSLISGTDIRYNIQTVAHFLGWTKGDHALPHAVRIGGCHGTL